MYDCDCYLGRVENCSKLQSKDRCFGNNLFNEEQMIKGGASVLDNVGVVIQKIQVVVLAPGNLNHQLGHDYAWEMGKYLFQNTGQICFIMTSLNFHSQFDLFWSVLVCTKDLGSYIALYYSNRFFFPIHKNCTSYCCNTIETNLKSFQKK